jgi:ribosomal protein S18 acetylase RimI-like enzyme
MITREAVRDARPEDAPAIARVEVETWRAAYADLLPGRMLASMSVPATQAHWLRRIGLGGHGALFATLVAEHDGEVIGFASGGGRRASNMARLDMLYVLPEAQGGGAGSALLAGFAARATEAGITAMWCEVLAKNVDARRFYRSQGGVDLGPTWRFMGPKLVMLVSYGWSLPLRPSLR